MATVHPFWTQDPKVLFRYPYEIIPMKGYSIIRTFNTLARLTLYLGIYLALLEKKIGNLRISLLGLSGTFLMAAPWLFPRVFY